MSVCHFVQVTWSVLTSTVTFVAVRGQPLPPPPKSLKQPTNAAHSYVVRIPFLQFVHRLLGRCAGPVRYAT